MKQVRHTIEDKDIEKIMGNLLRYGVLLSAAIVTLGAILYIFQHGHEQPHYTRFLGEPTKITEFKEVWRTALQGRGRSIIQLGLFVLIATPVTRIIFSVISYILERDYLYIIITAIVLFVILYNMF